MAYELPAHLKGRHRGQRLADIATTGIGGGLPPHISIQGNEFTLIDAAGNEQSAEGSTIQAVIADMSKVMCKMYYGKEFTPGSNDPPVCWSTNGLAPSRDAISPQNTDCASCQWNERGSAVSKISGASIKACRDEKHLAVFLPKHPGMLFRLVITPGSFKNWSAFTKPFDHEEVDINDVLVTIGFQPKTNGVLTFQATEYVDPESAAFCDQAVASKATDALVGRNDVPWAGYQRAIGGTVYGTPTAEIENTLIPKQKPQAEKLPEAQPEQPQRRQRRTKAEMAAARGDTAQNGPTPPQPAPFRPAAAPFGIGPGSAPSQEVKGMLDGIFKK